MRLWGIVAVAIALGALLASRDEVLSPAAQHALAPYPVDFAADNAFLHLLGLNAPAGSDNLADARRWIETFLAARTTAEIKRQQASFETRLPLVGDRDVLCAPSKSPCLPRAAQSAEAWRQALADNRELLRRAQVMVAQPRFDDFYVPDSLASPLPNYKYATQAQLLELSEIALAVQAGQLDSALLSLETRIAFDRRMLEGARTQLGIMIASSMLRHDYRLLGEIVTAQRGRLAPWRARLLAMSAPLSLEICKSAMLRGIDAEAHMQASFMRNLPADTDVGASEKASYWYEGLFMKLGFRANATSNLIVRRFEGSRQRVAAFDPLRLEDFKTAERADNQAFGEITSSPAMVYNPLGKFMVSVSEQNTESYLLRLVDTALISRAVRVQVLAALAGTTDVPSLLASDPELFDPYTGQPLVWRAETRVLAVELRGVQTRDLSTHLEFPM